MIFLAKFKTPEGEDAAIADVFIDAADGDEALEALRRHDIDDDVVRLVEIPPGVFCAEVRWADEDAGDVEAEEDEQNPANFSEAGVVLEVSEALANFLELDANASSVIDVAGGGSARDR